MKLTDKQRVELETKTSLTVRRAFGLYRKFYERKIERRIHEYS